MINDQSHPFFPSVLVACCYASVTVHVEIAKQVLVVSLSPKDKPTLGKEQLAKKLQEQQRNKGGSAEGKFKVNINRVIEEVIDYVTSNISIV